MCAAVTATRRPQDVAVDAADFEARFAGQTGHWTVAWKWAEGDGPARLANTVDEYCNT